MAEDVRSYGAAGDGETDDSDALQGALDAVAAAGGGELRVPPGTYLTGPLVVGDHTTVHVESGATIQFRGDVTAFPIVEGRWEGWDQHGFHPCLLVEGDHVRVEGGGTIDGGGTYWWELVATDPGEWPAAVADRVAEIEDRNEAADDVSTFTHRPPLLQVDGATDVTLTGVTLRNSPFWNTHVVYSTDVTLHDLRIENPPDAPNGDGVDVDSSTHVRIADCFIDAGDDAICLKSGKDAPGRAVGRPTENVTVTNCTVEAGHGGVVVGSEMSGDVRDVTVSNCTFTGTDRGVRIKTQRGRGGVVEDLRFEAIQMRDVVCPFVINGYYFTDIESPPEPVDETTPTVRNVTLAHVTARNVASAAFIAGLPERHFSGITLEDVAIEATRPFDADDPDPSMAEGDERRHGVFVRSMDDVTFRDVTVSTREGPAFELVASADVCLDGVTVPEGQTAPAIDAREVDGLDARATRLPGALDPVVATEDCTLADPPAALATRLATDEPE